jgi:hypothetical protein
VGELERGYSNLLAQTNTISGENKQYREQLASLTTRQAYNEQVPHVPGGSPGAEPRVDPTARATLKDSGAVMKFAEKTGLDVSDVADFAQSIYDPIVEIAQQAAQDAVAPIYANAEADAYMHKEHPDASKFTPELMAYHDTAPEKVKSIFANMTKAGERAGALEYLYLKYRHDMGNEAQGRIAANAEVTEEQRVQARADAGVSSSSPGTPIHAGTKSSDEPAIDDVLQLAANARSGDIHDQKAYRDATVGRMLQSDPNFVKMIKRFDAERGAS